MLSGRRLHDLLLLPRMVALAAGALLSPHAPGWTLFWLLSLVARLALIHDRVAAGARQPGRFSDPGRAQRACWRAIGRVALGGTVLGVVFGVLLVGAGQAGGGDLPAWALGGATLALAGLSGPRRGPRGGRRRRRSTQDRLARLLGEISRQVRPVGLPSPA